MNEWAVLIGYALGFGTGLVIGAYLWFDVPVGGSEEEDEDGCTQELTDDDELEEWLNRVLDIAMAEAATPRQRAAPQLSPPGYVIRTWLN